MPATSRRNPDPVTEPVTAPVSDDADQLRALVSAMLSGAYKEEFYLWDVASLCRAKPEFARQLLALIDRYHRLGQMPAAQHQKIKEKVEQTLAARAASPKAHGSDGRARATTTAPLSTADAAAGAAPATAAPATATPAAMTTPAAATTTAATGGTAAAAAPAAAADPLTSVGPMAAAVAATAATQPVNPAAITAAAAARAAASAAAAQMRPQSADMTAAQVIAAAEAMAQPASAAARAAAPTAMPIGPGTVLRGRYELQVLLGSGGMGSVYKALDRYRVSLGLPDSCVALKVVTAQPLGAASVLALGREFHNAQQLSHPNVINVYEIDHEGDASFYTMELLDGERLSQLLERTGGPLPERYALTIIRDVGAAIAHAHSRGIVHGDLKPHNIFITYGGQVRLLDFGGLSHSPREPWIADAAAGTLSSSYRTATPAYASCEQLEGHRAEPRDDIYALACIAYELLAGRHPFDFTSSTEARAQRLRPLRPAALRAERWRALRHGLAWERERRPGRVEPWLGQLGIGNAAAHLPPTHQLSATAVGRGHSGRAVLAAVLLLAAAGGAVFAIGVQHGTDWRQSLAAARARLQSTLRDWQATAPVSGSPAADTAAHTDTTAAPPTAASGSQAPPAAPPPKPAVAPKPAATRAAPAVAPAAAAAPASAVPAPVPASAPTPASTAGTIGARFAYSRYAVADTAPAARVVVRRTGNPDGEVRFVWWTVPDSAEADVDYAPLGVRTEDIPSGVNDITIYIPIISNPLRHQAARFYVALGAPGATPSTTPSELATVTIERGG
jgi:hypothetical protein